MMPTTRRGGRVVDCTCLENRSPGNGTVSSNLTPSAPMRYLGIDFGSKRIGLAVSDETGRFAMPREVVANDARAADTITKICQAENIGQIVIGQSLNYQNQPNPILAASQKFAVKLAELTKLPLAWEPEFLTSQEAKREIGKDDLYDARAAALILKNYLDRQYSSK